MSQPPLQIFGSPGSPYSRKLRAVLRYRRIPHHWITLRGHDDPRLPPVPVKLMPVLVFPEEGRAAIDSTPLIRELEERHPDRRVVPADPVLAFLDALLEDYADEWVTKMMFHYRWAYPADVEKASRVLPLWGGVDAPEEQLRAAGRVFAERQVGRLHVVGSNETTAPVIEESYLRLLRLLDAQLSGSPFLFGRRPAAADFALFGQLTQLALFDPTPAALAIRESARVVAWIEVVEDLSGLEPGGEDWISRDEAEGALRGLLCEVGRVYAPFLLANAATLEGGAERVVCQLDGRQWVQKPFPYQGKCLRALRDQRARLSADDRRAVDRILEGSGCEALFAAGA